MINIKPFKQTDDSRCGPACVKMILDFYGIKDKYGLDISEDIICRECNWSYELGCTNDDIVKALRSYDIRCEAFTNSTLEDLQRWVSSGYPVIVDWLSPGAGPSVMSDNQYGGEMPNGHSSIVVDIDDKDIYLADPEVGALRYIPRDEFLRVWFDWEQDPYLQRCEDLVLQLAIVIYGQ